MGFYRGNDGKENGNYSLGFRGFLGLWDLGLKGLEFRI